MPKANQSRPGYFDEFGGQFVPEVLINSVNELDQAYKRVKKDKKFQSELRAYLKNYVGRPSPLTYSKSLSKALKAHVYLKREDLLHTGAHKINNTIGQVLLAKAMGKKRIIAETGAGQHGVATATACALMGLPCVVYMGQKDMLRQSLNVYRMRLMGAEVVSVTSGSQTLKDAINEAIRDWIKNVKDSNYVIGSVVGPHPYPTMVRNFQSVIGKEVLTQTKSKKIDAVVACVGGGSNAMGLFYPFINSKVRLIGIEAAGLGVNTLLHAATLSKGSVGILHGFKSLVLQNAAGQIQEAHSISAGLDYPGIGPEHAALFKSGRAEYYSATDKVALKGFRFLSENEGIIPALESSHAIGFLLNKKSVVKPGSNIVLCISGRGDKDVEQISKVLKL